MTDASSKKQIVICVNGILKWPWDWSCWNFRTCVWAHKYTDCRVLAVEYFCGIIGRAFCQGARARRITALLQSYGDEDKFEITLVGHSNGCAVILAALDASLTWPTVKAIHLFSGACQADFRLNGLNEAIEDGRVGKVFVYVGGKDLALRLASHWLGRLLGYGVLGLKGALNVSDDARESVGTLTVAEFGHSDWWLPEHFDRSMKLLFAN
jgi:pimeloyl-ACP methyl ester carboxylesterase